jgi:hypothetical protein
MQTLESSDVKNRPPTMAETQTAFACRGGRWDLPAAGVGGVAAGVAVVDARYVPGGRGCSDPGAADAIQAPRALTVPQQRLAVVFALTVAGWIALPFLQARGVAGALLDTGVAMAGAVAVFALRSGQGDGSRLLHWEATTRVP